MSYIYTSGTYTPGLESLGYNSFLNNFFSVDNSGNYTELSSDVIPFSHYTVHIHNNGPGTVGVGPYQNLVHGVTNPYTHFAAYPIPSGGDLTLKLAGEDFGIAASESGTTINFILIVD